MSFFQKIIYKILFLIIYYSPKKLLSHSKIQNKLQISSMDTMIISLKNLGFYPDCIFDIGCAKGEWFKKTIKYFSKSKYYLFDGDDSNNKNLEKLKKNHKNLSFEICLLSDVEKEVSFYKMGYGSSLYEEKTNYKRVVENKTTQKLINFINKFDINSTNNLIKLDVQGSEIDILEGLEDKLNNFEAIILETSIKQYNKNAPLYNDVINYMIEKKYVLHDLCDLKRVGETKSFLLQFDLLFLRKNSNFLKNIKFD